MLLVKVLLSDGDSFETGINATPAEAKKYYQIGSWLNVGIGPNDNMSQIKAVEIKGEKDGKFNQ